MPPSPLPVSVRWSSIKLTIYRGRESLLEKIDWEKVSDERGKKLDRDPAIVFVSSFQVSFTEREIYDKVV